MRAGRPSRTALGAAAHRAAHQVLEGGRVFSDPLAVRILGTDAEAAISKAGLDPTRRPLRLFIAVRSRFAEDALAVAFAEGVRQLVVLGAGLDTYACRSPLGEDLRIFEVDHPATQEWKRERLAAAAIPVPRSLTFVPVDFEEETLARALPPAGFDPDAPAFFTWLGVVPYLTEEAVFATLAFIGGLPGGSHVVFDYGNPPLPGEPGDRYAAFRDELSRRVEAAGETFRSHFETASLHVELRVRGFRRIEDLGPSAIRDRFFPGGSGAPPDRGGHVVHASTR
ncbi:MAG TPA: SAM-dependent methyltransferase [Thermoanaerobaculia bacterium]|nr:SAM-dependent methyltransferase [Thermoanaerobaculia bacterium]